MEWHGMGHCGTAWGKVRWDGIQWNGVGWDGMRRDEVGRGGMEWTVWDGMDDAGWDWVGWKLGRDVAGHNDYVTEP